jgi:hypothetical protein
MSLAVDFPEIQNRLDDIAVRQTGQTIRDEIVEAFSVRIPRVPSTKIEGEVGEGAPDAPVEVDFGVGRGLGTNWSRRTRPNRPADCFVQVIGGSKLDFLGFLTFWRVAYTS